MNLGKNKFFYWGGGCIPLHKIINKFSITDFHKHTLHIKKQQANNISQQHITIIPQLN